MNDYGKEIRGHSLLKCGILKTGAFQTISSNPFFSYY
jgi:hypothetical protein